ncbi:cytochrome c oxidase subunit II [Nitrobacter winogradskyi]|uniref:Cytochrome c oxidase subunit 2 n=2 Tax=Nitrobacter winogradskyi TaxID=913 RepID=A0ACC6AD86_NITWI|nr:cytochrome c oxidase subunit II [Nitrobacter winogradskyi]MCP1997641.1 cytochrome c oxidase subunit 2 [Nitrobacter winogradskyi]GEC17349.1 hypothetical protein NWI01_32410 [Nitrobacter winogradskyi]
MTVAARLRRRPLAYLASLTILSGCTGPLSALDPAGPAAASTATLWWIMFSGAAVLSLLMAVLVALAFLKPGIASLWSARSWIIYGGLVMPGAVLSALLIAALVLGERMIARPLEQPPLKVAAQARQWTWSFAYPDSRRATLSVNVLHIPAGEPVDVTVTTTDVIHSFWVPRLGGKIDAIPGHRNVVRLQADRPGVYGGVCAEFCGAGHSAMPFTVLAHEPEEFAAIMAGAIEEARR